MLRPLNSFNDLAKRCLSVQAIGANLECARLIDGSCVDVAAYRLLAGHRFASNSRLLYKRVAAGHLSIDWNLCARSNEHNLSGYDRMRAHFNDLPASQHAGFLGKKIKHVVNGLASPANRKSFKNFCSEYKRGDNQCREEFPDGQRGDECDGH